MVRSVVSKGKEVKYRFFRIPAHGGVDEEELNRLLSTQRITFVDRQFVSIGTESFWALCVSFLDANVSALPKSKVDYRNILDEKQFAIFVKLRNLRKTLSEIEGVPPYAIFTNEQLASMVKTRVSTLAQLGSIEGIGDSRVKKYGSQFLKLLIENRIEPEVLNATFACRKGKGVLVAVERVQKHVQRHPWYVKIDIKKYFDSIDHEKLKLLLRNRFKKQDILNFCDQIVGSYSVELGKGLPIGALTSQHFANWYLSGLDRFLLENQKGGNVQVAKKRKLIDRPIFYLGHS